MLAEPGRAVALWVTDKPPFGRGWLLMDVEFGTSYRCSLPRRIHSFSVEADWNLFLGCVMLLPCRGSVHVDFVTDLLPPAGRTEVGVKKLQNLFVEA